MNKSAFPLKRNKVLRSSRPLDWRTFQAQTFWRHINNRDKLKTEARFKEQGSSRPALLFDFINHFVGGGDEFRHKGMSSLQGIDE